MEVKKTPNRLSPWVGSKNFLEFLAARPEVAFLLVQFLSEEVQAADGQLRTVWEQIPAGFPMGTV